MHSALCRARLRSGVWNDLAISLELQLWKMQKQKQLRGETDVCMLKISRKLHFELWKTLKTWLPCKKYKRYTREKSRQKSTKVTDCSCRRSSHAVLTAAGAVRISVARLVLFSSRITHFRDPVVHGSINTYPASQLEAFGK